ncbi:hypothetical protein [Planctobacterium marinum]|uniref:hypothetical protein n=1 Tax=Planctobacterium marinum TaxID=1631968 RepID=UPI001E58C858|nr:hypothetical protein [Planctobacterium marinum]MCC2608192.1 hypothetical protein [Planctobacterium marinum]
MNAMVVHPPHAKTDRLSWFKTFSDFLVIALILLVYWGITEYLHSQRMEIAQQPLVNDFYLVDYYRINPASDYKFRYVPLRVTNISATQLSFVRGNYGHNKPASMDKHVQFDAVLNYNYFNKESLQVSRAEFNQWVDEGIVYDASRPEGIYINGWIVLRPMEAVIGSERNERFLAAAPSR